jgi:SAM-dependent methyltransferase
MPTHRLYTDLAWLWPLLSPPADYRAESAALRRLIEEALGLPKRIKADCRPTMLDLGCGAGHLHSHLTRRFDVVGADLSLPMLRQARQLNPASKYVRADIRSLRLDSKFDVVLLHDAVSYMTTKTDLLKAMKTIREHLKPGAVGVVLPDYLAETIGQGESAEGEIEADGKTVHVHSEVVRGNATSGRAGTERFTLTMTFALVDHVAGQGRHRIITDSHLCGLFSLETWLSVFDRAGLGATIIRRTTSGRSQEWRPVTTARAMSAFKPGEGQYGYVVSRRAG